MDSKETKSQSTLMRRIQREASICESEPIKICWHCGASGHERNTCLPFHLDRGMAQLLPNAANPHIRELVKESVHRTIEIALLSGKKGAQLCFGGSPWQLHMNWPISSPPPPFPTPGVWYLGVYYGDD